MHPYLVEQVASERRREMWDHAAKRAAAREARQTAGRHRGAHHGAVTPGRTAALLKAMFARSGPVPARSGR